jgi:RNA-directed DNA polymerase
MHENRETSSVPAEKAGRSAKAQSQTADVCALEESDRRVIPMKQPNKEGQPSAEAVEGRWRPKENDVQPNTQPTQSGQRVSQGLSGVRQVARERKQERFTALLHHVTVSLLRESFQALKKNAAPGVDGVTWREYETGLEDRLIDLHSAASTVARIGHSPREECIYQRPMDDNVRWASRHWRTRSFNRPW